MSRPLGSVSSRWRLGPGVRWLDTRTLAGGATYHVITMTDRDAEMVRNLLVGSAEYREAAVDQLLGRLESAGLVLPVFPSATDHIGVTVVIPARSAPSPLRDVLRLAGRPARRHRRRWLTRTALLAGRRACAGAAPQPLSWPAGARNAGAGIVRTPWIAFLDADTVPDENWIAEMKGRITPIHNAAWPNALSLRRPGSTRCRGPGSGHGSSSASAHSILAVRRPTSASARRCPTCRAPLFWWTPPPSVGSAVSTSR